MPRYIVRLIRKRTPDYVGTYLAPSPVAALVAAGRDSYLRRVAILGNPLALCAELLGDDELADLQPSARRPAENVKM